MVTNEYILVGKVDDVGIRFDLLARIRYGLHATNQDVLLIKLLSFFGVLLTEACYCSRLYGSWVGYCLLSRKEPSLNVSLSSHICIFAYQFVKMDPSMNADQ